MKKELILFIAIFLFLAIGMHFKEWISYPIDHLLNLPNSGAYGFGALHPFIFTAIAYIVILIPRGIIKLLFFKKN